MSTAAHQADSHCLAPSRGVPSAGVDPSHQAVPAEHLDTVALTALNDLLGGDDDALAELAGAFLAEAPERIAEIRTAVDQNDAGLARRAGHTLKSNAFTFGAVQLGAAAHRVEVAGNSGDVAAVAQLLPEVEDAWVAVAPAVRRLASDGAT
jgi:HPt (histidine-containing phosphotransfer) domain-containing protein